MIYDVGFQHVYVPILGFRDQVREVCGGASAAHGHKHSVLRVRGLRVLSE